MFNLLNREISYSSSMKKRTRNRISKKSSFYSGKQNEHVMNADECINLNFNYCKFHVDFN